MKTPQSLTSHPKKTTSLQDCFLCSRIKIEETRISRRVSIPNRVYFDLNWELVNRINQIKAKCGSLYLEPQQLADLRHYSLINSPLGKRCDALSLVFSINYSATNSQKTTVVRSTINLSGQISQEIQRDLWQEDTQFLFQVIEAHYWLIGEILRQLPLESPKHTAFIFGILWLLVAIAISSIVFLFLPLSFLFKSIVIFLLLYLLKTFVNRIIARKLKSWIVRQLVSGWLSNKTNKRQLGFKLLSLLT